MVKRSIGGGTKDFNRYLTAQAVSQFKDRGFHRLHVGGHSGGPSKLSLVGVLSGEVIELPDFRNIAFILNVAQRKRSKMLKLLEYFMQEHRFSLMWVFISGDRIALGGVGERIRDLHRRKGRM